LPPRGLAGRLTLDEALPVLVLIAARFAGRLALERPVMITELDNAAATLVHLPALPRRPSSVRYGSAMALGLHQPRSPLELAHRPLLRGAGN